MKPRFVTAILLVLALAVPSSMLAQQNSKAEKEVRAALTQHEEAIRKGGTEAAVTYDKLLTDDFVRINPDGVALSKTDIQDGYRSGKTKFDLLEDSDVKIRIYGHTAVVTGVTTEKGIRLGASFSDKARWTRVFVKQNGIWQCVLYQSTAIKQ